ncbi:MAG: hypothetical protein PHF00_08415, partial [Elusimicrobia bacterium]|nr:hypothetical protein [Elusimicrobiota bacterium]
MYNRFFEVPPMMTTALRVVLVFGLSVSQLWAGPAGTESNAGRAGSGSGVNVGLPSSGGSVTGNNTGLGGAGARTLDTGKTVLNAGPAPAVTGGAAAAPAAAAATPAAGAARPTLTAPAVRTSPPASAPAVQSDALRDRRLGSPAARGELDAAARDIQAGLAEQARGLGEASVDRTLDRVFDASRVSGGAALAGVK